jgi:tetratricopeptide (TPR) repeat protein
MRTSCLVGLLILSFLAASSRAEAQQAGDEVAGTEAEADDPDTRARGLFLAGQAAYDRAQFEEALGYFEGAYRLSPRGGLLFNIGLAAERAGNRERALEAFRQYLDEMPDAANRADVEARIAALEASGGAEGTEGAETGSGEDGGPGILPWIAIGAGAAVAVVGGVLLGVGLGDKGSVEGAPMDADWADYEGAYGRAPVLTTLGFVMLGVGVAGAALGVVLLTMGGGQSESPSATVSIGPGSLRLSGRF